MDIARAYELVQRWIGAGGDPSLKLRLTNSIHRLLPEDATGAVATQNGEPALVLLSGSLLFLVSVPNPTDVDVMVRCEAIRIDEHISLTVVEWNDREGTFQARSRVEEWTIRVDDGRTFVIEGRTPLEASGVETRDRDDAAKFGLSLAKAIGWVVPGRMS